jgi:hypothetical protein
MEQIAMVELKGFRRVARLKSSLEIGYGSKRLAGVVF